ncbi:MAG TPA: tetratricopeptide repeat protein [Saprospiraceae bacterium]|jgi:tetratricopeptide (TPR) repeat protein|nr:tetratricopeptide repeat protein [Saprospiraceae bacterium]HMT52200.1 tetratricopeptide repeat protein [Saprospiraceae bacterium]HMT69097.1 tetratricopeptide repeat protein [Saprospiraceae bacterium]
MRYLLYFLLIVNFVACKNETKPIDKNDLGYLESEYQKSKADSSFNKLVQAYGKAILASQDAENKETLLLKAIEHCNVPDKENLQEVFILEFLKFSPKHKNAADYLYNLAERMDDRNKTQAAAMLYDGFQQRFPNDKRAEFALKKVDETQKDHENYFKELAKRVLDNPGEKGVNEANTTQFIDMSESFALAFPTDPAAPVYLMKGADMCRALGNTPEMLSLYDWVYQYYPKYEKAPLALFLRGFTLDTELGKFDEAKRIYEKFLANYPQDSMAKDVKFLLENIGKTPDEMFKEMKKE